MICSRHIIFWANENQEDGTCGARSEHGEVRNVYNTRTLLGKTSRQRPICTPNREQEYHIELDRKDVGGCTFDVFASGQDVC